MSLPQPEGVEVTQTLDGVQLVFSARNTVPTGVSRFFRQLWRRPLLNALLIGGFGLMAYVILTIDGSAFLWAFVVMMGVLLYTAIVAQGDAEARQEASVPEAHATLSAHRLCLTDSHGTLDVSLDQIEKVTVDAAGARIRVDGRAHYLLPDRPAADRVWIAAQIAAAVERRKAQSVPAGAERAQLERLLSTHR